ncbi:P-loop containing nucleoside triphosphate hydrolase protein [Ceratobasidium sp. AG-Ba]|nr:P-loop containing nucleoside triphosphate hydrolase protein [Ceratobasidium sp. AG-Ba]
MYNGRATFAWEASPESFGGSALLNLASNVLLGSAFGQNGTEPQIFASYQGLPGTRMANVGMAAKWEGFFSANMGVWPLFLIFTSRPSGDLRYRLCNFPMERPQPGSGWDISYLTLRGSRSL